MQPDPALRWFTAHYWTPFPFQQEVWAAYANGESGLIHSPTGTGKTYAVWFAPLLEWLAEPPRKPAPARSKALAPALRVLWITPLRALATDTATALQAPLSDLHIPWTVETRTSDTTAVIRNRQRTRLPTALITTPESLSLLLSRDNAEALFSDLRAVIVDEWHELLSTKRGVQTELALARLRRWRPALRTWGLSATVGNLDAALRTLIGVADDDTGQPVVGRLVQGDLSKEIRIQSILPERVERFPWAGHLGLSMLPRVLDIVERNRTTLIFTNTRSQTERWYQEILELRPEWAGEIALHHSSLDADTRAWVENGLRTARLRCVVCTSSLDLGVDFPAVDTAVQVGSPKGAARLLQRAGRSGHRPGLPSIITCAPTNTLELLEVSAARDAIAHGQLEDRPPLINPLDVLVQRLVTVGLGGGFDSASLLREVRTTQAYRSLSDSEWAWAVDFVAGGGAALHNYPEYHRLEHLNGRYVVTSRQVAQAHRMAIGTILGDAQLQVQYIRGPKIGSIEESFVTRLKPGDKFTLAGKVLQFVRLHDLKVWVRRATSKKGVIPRWYGGSLPLSEELTRHLREKLRQARNGVYADAEMNALRPIFELQAKWSQIPLPDELLIETTHTRDGYHLFFYPFEGRLVHEGMAALVAWRLARLSPITFTLAANDYGFELLSPDPPPLDEALAAGLLSTAGLHADILSSLNASEMAKRQFREIARVAGLVMQRYPGGQKSMKQLQASSGLIFDVLTRYDPGNLLLAQAHREVLQRQLEHTRLHRALDRIGHAAIVVRPVRRPTPFAFPLLIDRLRQTVSSETLEERVRKLIERYERWADA
jgi:ATP-dependent Lhr-like helicase